MMETLVIKRLTVVENFCNLVACRSPAYASQRCINLDLKIFSYLRTCFLFPVAIIWPWMKSTFYQVDAVDVVICIAIRAANQTKKFRPPGNELHIIKLDDVIKSVNTKQL